MSIKLENSCKDKLFQSSKLWKSYSRKNASPPCGGFRGLFCIIDARTPQAALDRLAQEFTVVPFRTQGITYEAISCHPDVFIFQHENQLIVAPNIPQEYKDFFQKHTIDYSEGTTTIDESLRNSVAYNCVATSEFLFHKTGMTDSKIQQLCTNHTFISLPQAYTRCSMIALNNQAIITSDKGIAQVLKQQNFDVCYIDPHEIQLPPYPYGFIGGCMGIVNNTIYIIGSLDYISDGKKLRDFAQKHEHAIVELYDGKLYDGGGLFFSLAPVSKII
ncbi:MAG: hypothetical protein FWC39_05500 [Bacteroidetes bacterium]|nr:hypothetical protein [Bacteroidota bacterium]